MRLRSTIIPVVAVLGLVAVNDMGRQAGGPMDTLVAIAQHLSTGALYAVGFWAASAMIKKWTTPPDRDIAQPVMRSAPLAAPVLPVPSFATSPWSFGPGQYRVRGVDHDTNFETTEVVFADSPSNAQLKVELKGVHVAAVERAC